MFTAVVVLALAGIVGARFYYEILVALVIFAIIWPLRHRFRRPGTLLATVVALYSVGRFLLFFAIRDTDVIALGLRQAQWTSLGLLAVAFCGLWVARRGAPSHPAGTAVEQGS